MRMAAALLGVMILGLEPAHAKDGSLGFDILGSFYNPRDSRYQGVGTGVGINIKMDDSLTLGYRVLELHVRGVDAVAGVQVLSNATVTNQGITGRYSVIRINNVEGAVGLWMGASTTASIGAAAATPAQTSPFLEPELGFSYSTEGKIQTSLKLGIGYRFVRNFQSATPFGAGSAILQNFDGLDLTFGVGVAF